MRLSPLARLYFTLDQELRLDKSFIADEARYRRLVDMFKLSEQKRDTLLRTVLILDAIALLLLFGKSIHIPGVNIGLNEIPAAREIVIVLSSLAFQVTGTAFLNWHGYAALLDTINLHRSRETGIDPDFLGASDKFLEFVVKLYRTRMNFHGPDMALPGRSYRIVSFLVTTLIFVTMFSLLCLHLAVVALSMRETISVIGGGIQNALLLSSYAVFVCAANLGGVLIFATLGRPFKFTLGDLTTQAGRQNQQL